jgi:esterase/lipase
MDKSTDINFYCLSGLGADGRLFSDFKPDFGHVICLNYIDPLNKEETLSQYAKRLAKNIDESKPFILVGISLGGILATEIAHIKQPFAIVFLSTIKSAQEKTGIFGLIKGLKIPYIFTFKRTQKYIRLAKKYFDTEEQYLLFRDMLRDTSPLFGQWAMLQIIDWDGIQANVPFIHINGKRDELFPVEEGNGVYLIPKKRHDMTLNSWPILNPMINKWLTQFTAN